MSSFKHSFDEYFDIDCPGRQRLHTLYLQWPTQRSRYQWRWWRLCRWCHWSLFSILPSTYTEGELAAAFCQVSGFSVWLGLDKEKKQEEEEDYPLTTGSSERWDRSVYLGKLIDWEERWWGEKRREVVEASWDEEEEEEGHFVHPHLLVLIMLLLQP